MSDKLPERNARLWRRTLQANPGVEAKPSYLRNVTLGDAPALGALFFEAFLGTIDDAGQTEAQYASKTQAMLNGCYGEWIPTASWAIEEDGCLRSAGLVCDYLPYGCPVFAIVATRPLLKRMGDAGTLMNAALSSLIALGHMECCAMITVGNDASERLFSRYGFMPEAR